MASLSARHPTTLAGSIEYSNSSSSGFRTWPDAPASLYPSLSLLPSELESILSQPSHLDLLPHLILQRLSQPAGRTHYRSARLSPLAAEVLALREISPSSETNTAFSEGGLNSAPTSNYTHTIHDMTRKSSRISSIHLPTEAFHMRTRRTKVHESAATGQLTTSVPSIASADSPALSTPDLSQNASAKSSSLSPTPSSQDDVFPMSSTLRKSTTSGSDSVDQIWETNQPNKLNGNQVMAGKRKKVSHDADKEAIAMLDDSYYARRPSLEDQFKQIAEAAKGADEAGRRTRRSITASTDSRADAETSYSGPTLLSGTLVAEGKHKAGTSTNEAPQTILDVQRPASKREARKSSRCQNRSSGKSSESPESSLHRSPYPQGPMIRDPRIRLNFILGILEDEENAEKRMVTKLKDEDSSAWQKSKDSGPEYHEAGKIYFDADGETIYRPDSEAQESPARSNRSGGRGGRRGGAKGSGSRGGGNGNGGRGRPRGKKGGGDDDQEPPRKTQLSEEEEEVVKKLKQRQQELRKLFSTVGAHQAELLDQIAARDLNKLIKKARAHTKVPEYEDIRDELQTMIESEQQIVRKRYEIGKAAELKRYEQAKELINLQYRRRCEDTRLEHLQGLQGDIISLKKAHTTALDDTHTEAGSEVDYFPRYHEFPEPDAHVRGYTSSKITDEKPFKEYLESRGDLDLQDVINEDITGPMIDSIQRENAKHAEEERVRRTETMEALSNEATTRLDEMKGFPLPRPLRQRENDAFGLSLLADISEYHAQRYPQQQYIYLPLSPGEHVQTGNLTQPAPQGQGNGRPLAPAPTPVLQQPIPVTTVPSKRPRNRSKTSVSSISSNAPIRPSLSLQTQTQTNGIPHPLPTTVAPTPISIGPGQPIAPAPPKAHPPFSATTPIMQAAPSHFRRPSEPASQRFQGYAVSPATSMPPQHQPSLPSPPHMQTPQSMSAPGPSSVPPSPRGIPSPRSSALPRGQQFVFQPPAGMLASPKPGYGPQSPLGGPQGGTQGKIPVTFVNQTIESRKAAAAAKARRKEGGASEGNSGDDFGIGGRRGRDNSSERRGSGAAGASGGVRMLLPKQ